MNIAGATVGTADVAPTTDHAASGTAPSGMPRRPIARSILKLIGDTPTIPYPDRPGVYLKLEGFNPTGSIADRLLAWATVDGAEIHVVGDGPTCASTALLGVVLAHPVTYQCADASPFLLIAGAFGARPTADRLTTIHFNTAEALAGLVREIVAEVPDVGAIILPATCPLRCAVDEIDGVRIQWVAPRLSDDLGDGEHRRLARYGIMIDRLSAACVAAVDTSESGTAVVVALADGALAYVS
jgi:hypothetical protein